MDHIMQRHLVYGVSQAWSRKLIGWKRHVVVLNAEQRLVSESRIFLVPIGESWRTIEACLVLEERVQLAPHWVWPVVMRHHPSRHDRGRPGGAIAPQARVL